MRSPANLGEHLFLKHLGTYLPSEQTTKQSSKSELHAFLKDQQVTGFNTKHLSVISEPVIYNINSNSFSLGMNPVNYSLNKKLAQLMVYLQRIQKPKSSIISIPLQNRQKRFSRDKFDMQSISIFLPVQDICVHAHRLVKLLLLSALYQTILLPECLHDIAYLHLKDTI